MSLYIGNKKYAPIIRQGVNNQNKTITENGVYTADEGYTGLGEVSVNVPQGEATRFGVNFDDLLGVIDNNGVLNPSTASINLNFDGVRDIGSGFLSNILQENTNIVSVNFPDLTTLSSANACSYMFSYCTSLISANFPSLTTISGNSAFSGTFADCTSLTSINFPKLNTISGSYACANMLPKQSNLTSVSFPALTTTSFGTNRNQFYYMFNRASQECTLHFPSNLQSTIAQLINYPMFGNDSLTLAFDLPATS